MRTEPQLMLPFRSASASELLINGLSPHIDVVQIGTATYGKNVGSITIYDYVDNSGDERNPNGTIKIVDGLCTS